jgi:hypothetical protein
MEEEMSRKLRNGLIIGGSVLGLIIVVIIVLAAIGPRIGRSYSGTVASMPVPQAAFDYGVGGGVDEMMEMPAAEMAYDKVEEEAVEAGEVYYEGDATAANGSYGTSDVVTEGAVDDQQQVERLIIRNGNITMSVDDTRDVKAAIEEMIGQYADEGAFVVSSNEYGGSPNSSPYISLSIRIPATEFDAVMDQLEGMAAAGTNPSINEYSEDVTEEYVDLQARTESLEAARDRLLDLMENAATTEDLLMAEQQLTAREAEIESLKGRLRYLSESARLSRIDIELQPYILSQPVDTRWRPMETIREALESLVDGLRWFADFMIVFLIAVLPLLALFGAVIYGIVRFIIWRVRVGKRKRAEREAMEDES